MRKLFIVPLLTVKKRQYDFIGVLRLFVFIFCHYCVFSPGTLKAQKTFEVIWTPTLLPPMPRGVFVQEVQDGGFFVIATQYESGMGFAEDISVILYAKLDENGNIVWSKNYGKSLNDGFGAFCGALTSDGNFIIAGCKNCYKNPPDPKSEYLLIKVNSIGDTIWSKTYGRDKRCWAEWVEETYDKGFILTGYGASSNGSADIWVVKTDSAGNLMWDKAFNWGEERGWCIRQTSDSGYIVLGTKSLTGSFPSDILLLKLKASGDTMWTKKFHGSEWGAWGTRFFEVEQTDDNGYIFVGYRDSAGLSLTKTDVLGNMQWTKAYKSVAFGGVSVQQTIEGGFIVVGNTGEKDLYGDILLMKTDINGDSLWTSSFGKPNQMEEGFFVRQCFDGGYIVIGYNNNIPIGTWSIYLIKTDANGQVTWVSEVPFTEQMELQVFPNPLFNQVTLNFRLPYSEKVYIAVYDIAGNEKSCLFEDMAERNRDYTFNFKTDELDAGIYLLEMNAGNKKYYNKLVFVK